VIKLCWRQIEVCEMNMEIFGSFGRSYEFIFQIDWLGNRRKWYSAAGSDQAFPSASPLIEIYELFTGVLIFFHCTKQVSRVLYFDVVL